MLGAQSSFAEAGYLLLWVGHAFIFLLGNCLTSSPVFIIAIGAGSVFSNALFQEMISTQLLVFLSFCFIISNWVNPSIPHLENFSLEMKVPLDSASVLVRFDVDFSKF